MEKGNSWLEHKSPYYVIAASNLALGDHHFFPKSLLHKTVCDSMNPVNWWLSAQRAQMLPVGLVTLACKLMKLPSSTGGIERCFSTLGAIMSKQRNALEVEKASKLCFINKYFKACRSSEVFIDADNLE